MAEVRINDLPLATTASFSDNDLFLIVDDGEARLLRRDTFQAWMLANVQGEKGDTGAAGINGTNGTNGADGADGANGLSAYQVAVNNGFVGTESAWLLSLKGATGSSGTNGSNGWSPVFSVVSRGDDKVLQLVQWVGGTGTAPTTLGYIGASGIVTNIANAVNIRGTQGDLGNNGWTPVLAVATNSSSQQVMRVLDWILGSGDKPSTGYVGTSGIVTDIDAATPINNVLETVLVGLSLSTKTAVTNTDTLLAAIGKLQAQLTGMSNEAGQVKANYTGLSLTGFTANTFKTFDVNSATVSLATSPTTTYPKSTPNSYSGMFDSTRGISPTGRLIENPISGQVHGWRIQGTFSGKSTAGSTTEVLTLRVRNPVSGFIYNKAITLPNNLDSGTFANDLLTIADDASIPSPNGYVLEASLSTTDAGCSIVITAITRISYAKEVAVS